MLLRSKPDQGWIREGLERDNRSHLQQDHALVEADRLQ